MSIQLEANCRPARNMQGFRTGNGEVEDHQARSRHGNSHPQPVLYLRSHLRNEHARRARKRKTAEEKLEAALLT